VAATAPLVPFLQAIEEELAVSRLVDRADIFDIAMRALQQLSAWPQGLPVLLLDLPLRDVMEQRFIAAILACTSLTLATAVEGNGTAIEAHTTGLGFTAVRADSQAPASSLENLQRHLFEDSAPSVRKLDPTVSLASWPGEARECVEIARRIQVEATRGVPFDRMAVLLRAPGLYRAHLEEALRRASVPAWFARGSTRPDPAGRALLALLACAAEGLSARRFAEYLSLAQVPQPGVTVEDTWVPPEEELLPIDADRDSTNEAADQECDLDPDARLRGRCGPPGAGSVSSSMPPLSAGPTAGAGDSRA
jgi:hypothetical protein